MSNLKLNWDKIARKRVRIGNPIRSKNSKYSKWSNINWRGKRKILYRTGINRKDWINIKKNWKKISTFSK